MGSHAPVVYTTDQFKWYSSKQAFYTNVKMLTAYRHGNKKFKNKKKFIIVNPKTNVSVEFISDKEYTNVYRFRSRTGYMCFCYVFKPMFNPDDWKDISPVRFLKIYPTDEHKKYYVYYNGVRKKIYINYNHLCRWKWQGGIISTMHEVYKELGVKRLLSLSAQDMLDDGYSIQCFINILHKNIGTKFPYLTQLLTQLEKWGLDCPTFILQYKVTFVIKRFHERLSLYKRFKHKVRFCPIEKLLLKKG